MSWNTKWWAAFCLFLKLVQRFLATTAVCQKGKYSFRRDTIKLVIIKLLITMRLPCRCPIVRVRASFRFSKHCEKVNCEQKVCRKSELPSCSEGLGLCLMVNTVNPIYFSSAPLFLALFPTQLSSPNSPRPSFSSAILKHLPCLWIFPPFLFRFIPSCSQPSGKVIITWEAVPHWIISSLPMAVVVDNLSCTYLYLQALNK